MMRLAVTCIAISMVVALSAAELPPPTVTAGPISGVTIDGRVGAEEWAGATGVGAFARLGGPLARSRTSCSVAWDQEGLLVAWLMVGEPSAESHERDGDVWRDDAVELFVEPDPGGNYRHFTVNAAGAVLDEIGRDTSWDPEWEAAASIADGRWQVEMRIPFAALGPTPQPGDAWRVNFCRDSVEPPEIASWAPLDRSFHEPEGFGTLRFADEPAGAGVVAVGLEGHQLLVGAEVTAGQVAATLLAGEEEVERATAVATGTLGLPIEHPGRYTLRLEAAGAGGEALVQEVPIVRHAPVELSLRKGLLEARRLIVSIDASAAEAEPEGYRISAGGGEPVIVPAGPDPRRAEADVDLSPLEPGEVTLRVEAVRGGDVIAEAAESFELPPTPEWVGSDIGVSDELPEPWTPVRADGGAVRCWGREYAFEDMPLPAGIESAGAQLLTSPVRLVARAGGQLQSWRGAQVQWTEREDTHATGRLTAEADGARLAADLLCEFDGMMRIDLEVAPADGRAIEQLVLEIPLRAEHAKYLHLADASWGGSVSTALPAEGWEHHFMPFVWLGDEQRGLQWFAESDEGWRPAEPERVISIDRREGRVLLRLHMLEEPLPAGESFRTTFGLQATPVKPLDPEHRHWHITHGAWYGMQDQTPSLAARIEYPAAGHISPDRGTVEMWVRPLFDPGVEVERSTRGRFNRELFRLTLANGDHLGFYWNIDDRNMRLYTRVDGDVQLYASPGRSEPWEQGSWHHVAFTWGDEAAVFVDGAKVASHEWTGPLLPGTLEGATIVLGSPPSSTPCEFTVDELRISDVAREFEGVAPAAPLQADEHTLLYDGLDDLTSEHEGRSVHNAEWLMTGEGVAGNSISIGPPQAGFTLLDHIKQMGVNTVVYHQSWTEIQAYGSTQMHQDELRDLVAACHERDIKVLLYFGYELSDAAPEWDAYHDEVLVHPRRGGYQRKDIPQTAYICCYRSAWKEYILTGIARMIDEYDIDGVYLDGTTEPFGCANELHGCGYVGADGERHRTYPIFEVRDLMRRMRHIIKSRKPDGLISAHMSATVSMPTLAFVDSYWDGEQLDVHEHGFRLPLDAFRAEFMGHNWGVPAEFLCYYNRPFTHEEALALALLHDVPVRPTVRGDLLGMMSNVWAAWEAIDINAAEWFPYWEEEVPVTCADPSVLVSTHVGPGGALIVAANASAEVVETELQADPDALGVQAGPVAGTNVLTRRAVEWDGGRMPVMIQPWEAAIVLVAE